MTCYCHIQLAVVLEKKYTGKINYQNLIQAFFSWQRNNSDFSVMGRYTNMIWSFVLKTYCHAGVTGTFFFSRAGAKGLQGNWRKFLSRKNSCIVIEIWLSHSLPLLILMPRYLSCISCTKPSSFVPKTKHDKNSRKKLAQNNNETTRLMYSMG